ncbi:MAG TPA: hypothetical protein VMH61_06980 [Candidatus Acidoferrales bacterium]|nr:hypothetical protein [Candidatus Acidoferrales bacterium]
MTVSATRTSLEDRALAEREMQQHVISSLRNLGCSVEEARHIAERPEVRSARSLDARILRAVQQLGLPSARRISPATGCATPPAEAR